MPRYNATYEIHVHGDVQLRADVVFDQIQDAMRPLWSYSGANSLSDGAASAYEEEPGIRFDAHAHRLQICWTTPGEDDFRQNLEELCMALNELTETGAALEVTFYDADFDEEDEASGRESRDDFMMLFVGPTPAAIMQVQRWTQTAPPPLSGTGLARCEGNALELAAGNALGPHLRPGDVGAGAAGIHGHGHGHVHHVELVNRFHP
jgi:hypothetical protein